MREEGANTRKGRSRKAKRSSGTGRHSLLKEGAIEGKKAEAKKERSRNKRRRNKSSTSRESQSSKVKGAAEQSSRGHT